MSNEISRILTTTTAHAPDKRPMPTSPISSSTSQQAAGQFTDKVTLTSQAMQMQAAQASVAAAPVVDSGQVQTIKLSIAQGTYQVDARQVARQMVSFEASLTAAAAPTQTAPAAVQSADATAMMINPSADMAQVPQPGPQRSVSFDQETGTLTRSLSFTRSNGETFSREVATTRSDDGVQRSTSLDNGRGVTREGGFDYNAETGQYSREASYENVNGAELDVRVEGAIGDDGVKRAVDIQGNRGQPLR